MADYDQVRKLLSSMGLAPHEVERAVRENDEHRTDAVEVYRYITEIMGGSAFHHIWVVARVLARMLKDAGCNEHDKDLMLRVLQGIAVSVVVPGNPLGKDE